MKRRVQDQVAADKGMQHEQAPCYGQLLSDFGLAALTATPPPTPPTGHTGHTQLAVRKDVDAGRCAAADAGSAQSLVQVQPAAGPEDRWAGAVQVGLGGGVCVLGGGGAVKLCSHHAAAKVTTLPACVQPACMCGLCVQA